jgi:hypothetical protein
MTFNIVTLDSGDQPLQICQLAVSPAFRIFKRSAVIDTENDFQLRVDRCDWIVLEPGHD